MNMFCPFKIYRHCKATNLTKSRCSLSCWQDFLSQKGLVHRDLAARNVLVGHGKLLKIADFGLMRQVYRDIYEIKNQKKLPIKWMAPESIFEQVFTVKSDM